LGYEKRDYPSPFKELAEHNEVRIAGDMVWLTLNQISQLFNRDKSVISKHLANIYKEGELIQSAIVAKNVTVQIEKGYAMNQRMDRMENNFENLNNEVK